ncbi:MAG: PLP-dependent aminotransferase family protein [Alphaproteobacteria bacterium]|nr:PLP-dependent aminotransferase family protein [Alphaproteobacteria bacterium]
MTEEIVPTNGDRRYEAVLGFITDLVEQGALVPGDRAPSLRAVGRRLGVSVTTAIKAYQVLEDRGVLTAKPKSGFFVSKRPASVLASPRSSKPAPRANSVAIAGPVLRLLEVAADPSYLPFGCAIPSADLLSSGRLDRCLARAARVRGTESNTYGEARGEAALRHEIARRAIGWGQALSSEDIVVTGGCTEALAIALKAVATPGDTIAIESPTYFGLLQILEAQGLKAFELPTHATDGVELDALEAALQSQSIAACLFSSSFNNPLGATMGEEKKRALAVLLTLHGVPLIEDDIYGDIHFGEERPRPFMALAPEADIIYCSSFSKTLAPGYRVGWAASRRRMRKLLEAKFASTLSGPPLLQLAVADFLSSGGYDSHLRRMRRIFRSNLEQTLRAIERSFPAGTRVSRPAGGFVLWVELPGAASAEALWDQAMAERICFAPGGRFTTTDQFDHCLRISCGYTWSPALEDGIVRLGALASELA